MASFDPPPGWSAGLDRGLLESTDITAALERFAADARTEDAARARSRRRWLEQQLVEDTTMAGVLADLAQRDRPVLVHTTVAARHRGTISVLGSDFVGLTVDTGASVLVTMDAVAAVRTQPREHVAHSGRTVSLKLRFAEALIALQQERPRIRVTTLGGEHFSGDLRAVSKDVLTLRLDGDTRSSVYLRTESLAEVAIAN